MIRLKTLGALDLRSEDGTEAHSVLRQPKRLALLAYLALARPRGFQRRDRLLALFWPEMERERARHALSQAVFYLRRSLGRDIVVNRGDEEIGLAPEALWCDAVAFDAFLESGQPEEALALYRGELLAGFHVDDAPDFERWLDEERTRRAQRAADAAWSLSDRARAAGDVAGAREWGAKAIALMPWDERGLRRLIAMLDAAGDRAGAIAAYQDFARRLRTDLDIDPSAETQELVETIKARAEPNGEPEPAPLFATVMPGAEPVLDSSSIQYRIDEGAQAPASREHEGSQPLNAAALAGHLRSNVRWSAVVLVVLIASLAPFVVPGPDRTVRVAVLPVRDESPNAQYGHITDALTGSLIQLMHHPGSLHVVSEFGVHHLKDTTPTREEIVKRFDVGYIVSTVLTGSDERIKVTIELIDAETGSMIESAIVEKAGRDWLTFTEQVGAELAAVLRSRLGEVFLEQEWKAGTRSNEAWNGVVLADRLRHRAMKSETPPYFADALRVLAQADSLLHTARDQDPRWSEPYAMLARTTERRAFYTLHDSTATRTEKEALFDTAQWYAEQALERDGEMAASLELLGTLRHRRFLIVPPAGDAAKLLLDSAEADLRAALKIEPTRARAASTLSQLLYGAGRFGEALDFAETAFENDAYLAEMDNIANHLFELAFHLNDDDAAAGWCDEVGRRMPDTFPHAFCSLKLLSWGKDAPASAKTALLALKTFGAAETEEVRELARPCMAALAAPAVARDTAFGADSARALLHRARTMPAGPFTLTCLEYEAAALAAIGDYKQARARLEGLLEMQPTSGPRIRGSRFFQPLKQVGSDRFATEAR